ncbi:ADP-ribosylglycohydrolase family protein [bacterium]|nr:ADP-ribosylglycohydrolase family protein [bacterium]
MLIRAINNTQNTIPYKNISKKSAIPYNTSYDHNLAPVDKNYLTFLGIQTNSRHSLNNYYGCILGGAIGDALGADIEVKSLAEIHNIYGDKGLQNLENKKITDDTQMSLFTP